METREAQPKATVVSVQLGARSYAIHIGRDLLSNAAALVGAAVPGARVALVTDQTVASLHLDKVIASLDAADIDHTEVTVRPGEASKSFASLERVVDFLLEARLERGDVVAALGGGVVGDLAGFAAAIARRGMRVVQMPTTLLAQVDSSVGGKTGINTQRGKNLVGAFHQPSLVIADTGVLDTLSPRDFNAGYAELAKIGLIRDEPFFTWLEANWRAIAAGWPERDQAIAIACGAKAEVVAEDETERGSRALLNLGHTFGHALETSTGYSSRLLHGEGVSIGCCLAFGFSVELGLCPPEDRDRAIRHFVEVGLPTKISDIPGHDELTVDTLMTHIAQDKKVRRGALTFILVRGLGDAYVADDVPPEKVSAFLGRSLAP